MSLQVWLPLNGNLDNQGLSDVQPSIGSNTVDSSGKIGKCIKVTSAIDTLLPASNWDFVNKSVSFGCWAKISKSELQSLVSSTTFDSTNQTMGGCLLGKVNYGGLGLMWNTNNIYSSGALSGVGIYPFIRNSNGYVITTKSYTIPFDTWTHIMLTFDRENTKLSLYINGTLWDTTNLVIDGSYYTGNFTICNASWDSGNGISSSGSWRLNDVRVYDNLLSPLEIKQIAQGLVCHYKLAGVGGENLITNMTTGDRTTLIDNYGISADFSQNLDTYAYFNVSPALELNKTYTLSFDVSNFPDNSRWSWTLWNAVNYIFSVNKNGHYSYTFTPTASLLPSGYSLTKFLFDDKTRENPANVVKFTNFKIEEGLVATSWSPHKSDTLYATLGFNDAIEYDCSGFGNHGTKVGDIAWSNDTARYSGSYYFPTTSSYIKAPVLDTSGYANSYTFSYWAKNSSIINKMAWGFSDGNHLNLYPIDNGFCWNTGDGGANPFVNNGNTIAIEPYNGDWHHYAITGNGSTTTLYIDGEKKGITTYKPITGTQLYISGWDTSSDYKWGNGSISDFRLYATCLDSESVKSLYSTSASINETGTLAAYELVEV